MNRRHDPYNPFDRLRTHHGIPLFFKLWFGFIALIMLSIIGGYIFMAYQLASLGPEGVGHFIGSFLHAIKDSAG